MEIHSLAATIFHSVTDVNLLVARDETSPEHLSQWDLSSGEHVGPVFHDYSSNS